VATVERELSGSGVTTVRASVRALIAEKAGFSDLHFVYAAGLYDYLHQPLAARLTRVMFDMLRPGGRLLVANFAPSLRDVGYMEAYMAWELIYRDEAAMRALAQEIPPEAIGGIHLFRDPHENIVFLEVVRA
jgi:hypothetical protein